MLMRSTDNASVVIVLWRQQSSIPRLRHSTNACALQIKDVLREFGGSIAAGQSTTKAWDRLMDSDLKLGGTKTSFKKTVESRLLQPMQALTESYSSLSASAGLTAQPSYSALLFGPPGTAKTTTATSMARYLGWNFLRCVVHTADFCELCKY
eukprot:7188-Heterococcus_DN1.PRE.1